MREIKFRAWEKGTKILYDWEQIQQHKQWWADPLSRLNLMQYTGLLDKNGKEIYEGDIVDISGTRGPRKFHCIWSIGWDAKDGRWCFVYDTGEPARNFAPKDKQRWEIIGNIYENAELLGKQP